MKTSLTFQDQSVIEIRTGPSRALFAPQAGARLLSWEVNGRPIIAWPENADWSRPAKIRGGNPILFPFIARHYVDGIPEKWRDATGVIRDMPMHGFCREANFAVVPDAENTLRMRLRDSKATRVLYPFPFEFDVVYRLEEDVLEVEFSVTNRGTQIMPYQAGHHFYFAIPHGERSNWILDLPFSHTGVQTPAGDITQQTNETPTVSLDRTEIIDRFQIGLTNSHFALKNEKAGRQVTFDLGVPDSIPWYAVTTWTQTPESDFYCVEPWLGLPNAIHHGLGLRHLPPAQTERAICRLLAV